MIVLALVVPATASAHARFVGSKPADGAVLATPPTDVRILFDDDVRPASGNRAVDADGGSVLAGPARRLGGNPRSLVLPLRARLPRGSYTVRWSVVSDDGHTIRGVLAFAVGAGSPRPVPTLSAGGGLSSAAVVLGALFVGGVLLAGGAALCGRVLRVGRGAQTAVVSAGLVLVAGGGIGRLALERAVDETRFGRVVEAAVIVAFVGVAGALASLLVRALGTIALAAGLLELATPTLSGHALDPRPARPFVALADFVHLAGAAVWIGGIVLATVAGSVAVVRRLSPLALGAVAVLAATAVPRAIAALHSVGDLVLTGYGRALVVKTVLLVFVLAVAWLNRTRLHRIPETGPRRFRLAVEATLLVGIVAAVAVLTDLRPPTRASAAAVAPVAPTRPQPPPADAVVLGGQYDDVAIGLAASPRGGRVEIRLTALSPENVGVDGLRVTVNSVRTTPCGPGCYTATISLPAPPRRVAVSLSGPGRASATLPFTLPSRWPAAAATDAVARSGRVYRSLRTLTIHERLASSNRNVVVTTYRLQAPDRLAYRIVGGPEAVIVGATRWDRNPGGRWQRSQTEPLKQPEPFWGSDPVRNARAIGSGRVGERPVSIVSFFDPHLPAWFELWIDRTTSRLLALRMTAQAHFMRHRYSGFDEPVRIAPPRSTQP